MDPISALIGAGGRLLGGLFNKPPSAWKQSYQGVMGQAQGAREAAKEYGFNPLTLLGVSSPIGAGSGPMMGSAIADAFSLLADGIANRPGVGQKEALTRENADLRDQLRRQILQPQVPGIYPRMASAPSRETVPVIGPQPLVELYNPTASRWVAIHPGAADRLGLSDGQSILAEDYEALLGDVGSEGVNLPNAANEAVGQGNLFHDPPPRDYQTGGRPRRPRATPSFGFTPNPMFGF